MTPQTYATISGIGSIAAGIGGAFAKSAQYDVQKYQAKVNAKIAKMQGEADALNLQRQFNKTMASNVVMAAAQGRSGESVAGIARAGEEQLRWDADFARLSAQIQEQGYKAQATQYGAASSTALIGGSLGAISGGLTTMGKSLYTIGDK